MLLRSHFSGHDALLAQVVGDHRRGHAEVEILAGLAVDARRQQRELVRVDHRVAVGVAAIAVPRALGMEVPALLLALDHLGREVLPGRRRSTSSVNCEPRIVTTSGTNGIEEPLLLGASAGRLVVAAELAELLARLDAELDAAVPQHLAGLALVDLGVHVERGEQRVERRRRGVHQERFVEALVLDVAPLAADVLVALVDLRGLREAGALLVHRLRREQPGHLRRRGPRAASGCGPRTADGRRCSRSRPRPRARSRKDARSSRAPCARCRSCRHRSRAGCRRAGRGARPCAARGSFTSGLARICSRR